MRPGTKLEYRQIPQYQHINRGMSLEAFKRIFWWSGHIASRAADRGRLSLPFLYLPGDGPDLPRR